jgi:hypothetical protein
LHQGGGVLSFIVQFIEIAMSVTVNLTEISICNDALMLVAHPSIHDFEGETPASEVCARLYPLVLGRLLGAYPWRFAMHQARLTRLAVNPETNYRFAHALPAQRDGTPRRFYQDAGGSPLGDFAIFGDAVHTNSETVLCDYVKAGGLTGPFRDLLVRAMASDLALSLCDDRGMRDRFHADAYGTPREGGRGGLFKTAMGSDAQGAENRAAFRIGGGPLIDAHQGHADFYGRSGLGSW